jgi:hypothetical protein
MERSGINKKQKPNPIQLFLKAYQKALTNLPTTTLNLKLETKIKSHTVIPQSVSKSTYHPAHQNLKP